MMTESLECRLGSETSRNQSRSLSLKTNPLNKDRGQTAYRRLGEWLVRASDALLSWQYRAHERAHLMAMDDRMLRDIGLARADVEHEAAKPFWRP
jgi:uncharacterized protein YjiS (DUF1127 family)